MSRRRRYIACAVVAAAAVVLDAVTGGHYGTFACGLALGGVNAWWWSR